MLEVEVKAQCKGPEAKLMSMGAKEKELQFQRDVYFNSPVRDFKKTDEAFRIRCLNGNYFLTYKGPRIDSDTKTREEIEVPADPGVQEILEKLGFMQAAIVEKTRKVFLFESFTICVDNVLGLGEFVVVETDDYAKKERLFEILEMLGVKREETITESYLELLERKNK